MQLIIYRYIQRGVIYMCMYALLSH